MREKKKQFTIYLWHVYFSFCSVGCVDGCSGCDSGFLGSLCDVLGVSGSCGAGGIILFCCGDNDCSDCCSMSILEEKN